MGKTIVFIGIDGAGKTSIIGDVLKRFEVEGISCKRRYMGLGREYQLKFMEFLIGKFHKRKRKKEIKNKLGVESNYRERGFYWVLVQYLEFWARFIGEKFSGKQIILFDRYFYDGLILGNEKTFNFFRRFTPRPTKCFLVYANPQIIRNRKREAEIKDIENFYRKIDKLKKYFDIEVIDNNKDFKVVVDKVVDKIKNV